MFSISSGANLGEEKLRTSHAHNANGEDAWMRASPSAGAGIAVAVYCSSLVINCCAWLACDRAAMPVWLRIWYFDISDVACA
jgi:hypothetical protein